MDAQPVTSGNFERRLRHILESLESEDSRLTGKAGRIYEALEKDLLTGRYKFGADISAPELAKRLGVSRQPVMAALSQLRAAGYVTITPQVGCRVVTPTTEEISDFFRLFGAMEGVMARLAAERGEPGEGEVLRQLAQQIREVPTVPGNIPLEYAELVGTYHDVIRAMARAPNLARRVGQFWRMSDFLLWNGAPNVHPAGLRTASEQRLAIAEAIGARDSDRAAALMEDHVWGKPERAGFRPPEQQGRAPDAEA